MGALTDRIFPLGDRDMLKIPSPHRPISCFLLPDRRKEERIDRHKLFSLLGMDKPGFMPRVIDEEFFSRKPNGKMLRQDR